MMRIMILLLAAWALLIILATSCSTVPTAEKLYDESITYNPSCTTQIELRNGTKFEMPEDAEQLVNAEEGCVRHYGPKSCLTRFIKTGKLSYYAICRRN